MTLKGTAIIGQSGGCTAVINQSLAGVITAARREPSITRLWGTRNGVEGLLEDCRIDLGKVSSQTILRLKDTPSSALGSSRHKLKPGEEFRILENLKRWNVRYFFMVGGNDTADTLFKIGKAAEDRAYELRTIHIPKTIDNDLMETDHTPGFGSVARFAAVTTQEAGLDSRAMRRVDPVKIIELMGRNSGWIVAASALLKKKKTDPPHILLVPEYAFEKKRFLHLVENTLSSAGYCIVVISETIRDAKGRRLGERTEGIQKDPFGHPYVEGAAAHLARLVENEFKVRARFDKPGTIQRMSIPYASEVDQREAFEAGRKAVQWAVRGVSKVMVGFKRAKGNHYHISYFPVPLEKIPNRERDLPPAFFDPARAMVTPSFSRYALPLIGGCLPEYAVL